MNVICVGYFDKFSRFFIGVEKALQKEGFTTNFQYLSIHFSGFLFTWLRGKKGFWLPVRAWRHAQQQKSKYLKIVQSKSSYHGIDFNELIKFHQRLVPSINAKDLQIQALSYIDLYRNLFQNHEPNYILVVGDSRLSVEVCVAVAKKFNIKVYYLEQGPFNTTIFDNKGVNANLNFRSHFEQLELKSKEAISLKWIHNSNNKYKRSPFYRLFDFFIETLKGKQASFPPDLIQTDVTNLRNKLTKQKKPRIKFEGKKVFLLIFQVPIDVNMIYHSPHFSSHLEILKSVHKNLPKDCMLVVREHPVYMGLYESEIYNYINKNAIIIDNHRPLNEALKQADVVIVNNSTVGIEAISHYKKLVVLGNSFYDCDKICLKYNGANLKVLLEKAVNLEIDINKCQQFMHAFKESSLIDGAITDKDLKSATGVAKKILEHFKTNF